MQVVDCEMDWGYCVSSKEGACLFFLANRCYMVFSACLWATYLVSQCLKVEVGSKILLEDPD